MKILATLGVSLGVLLTCSWGSSLTQEPMSAEPADLAGRLGCFACHPLHGQGGNGAPSLNGVGARLAPQELRAAITFPRRLHSRARMPSYAYLHPSEQEAVVKFLETSNERRRQSARSFPAFIFP